MGHSDLIEHNLEELAELESIDNGKPYAVARVADLPLAVDMFRYIGGWATKITGTTLPLSLTPALRVIRRCGRSNTAQSDGSGTATALKVPGSWSFSFGSFR